MNAHYGPATIPGTLLVTGDMAANTYKVSGLLELTFLGQERVNKDNRSGEGAKQKNRAD